MKTSRATFLLTFMVMIVLGACSPSPEAPPTAPSTEIAQAATPVPPAKPDETIPVAPPPASAPSAAEATAQPATADEDEFEFFEGGEDSPAPQQLSEFKFFSDIAKQIPADGVVPYGLNTEHFADYARVQRFIHVPKGAHIPYAEQGVLDFPVGTVILQTITYPHDMRDPGAGERRVETRVLRRLKGGWDGVGYLWNKDGTDARRALAGGIVPVSWTDANGAPQTLKYIALNKNDCKRCHENQGVMLAIGPTIANLNGDYPYAQGRMNQITYWSSQGLLSGAPADPASAPRLARWDNPADGPADVRARAWLQVNCAHCHNPRGAGGVSGLDLRLTQDNPLRLGLFKPPVAAGRGSEGHRYSIEPGKPESSFLISRLLSVDPSVMMPPVGRRQSQAEAVALVSEWIAQMHIDETESEKLKAKQEELFQYVQREGKWPENLP